MTPFDTRDLPAARYVVAPDGSDVRLLLGLAGGGMAHFALAAGQVAAAVTHRSVEEIWFVVDGAGTMWRRQGGHEELTTLQRGRCLTIPRWPGDGEAVAVPGPWTPG